MPHQHANNLDRGILPGESQSFRHFITSSLGVSVRDQSVYFGLMASAFIIGHSVLLSSSDTSHSLIDHFISLHWERVSGSLPS